MSLFFYTTQYIPSLTHINTGGLWPAVWLLGNLGRATYEASTNNIWPWSYDTCDRKKQEAQSISGCNKASHFGLNKFQGRGATEIDLLELMGGEFIEQSEHCCDERRLPRGAVLSVVRIRLLTI